MSTFVLISLYKFEINKKFRHLSFYQNTTQNLVGTVETVFINNSIFLSNKKYTISLICHSTKNSHVFVLIPFDKSECNKKFETFIVSAKIYRKVEIIWEVMVFF